MFDFALADFNEALRIDPMNALAYKNRSAAFASLGNMPHATADYEKARALGIRD
jgi:Flp pilus assembly protein TadD